MWHCGAAAPFVSPGSKGERKLWCSPTNNQPEQLILYFIFLFSAANNDRQ